MHRIMAFLMVTAGFLFMGGIAKADTLVACEEVKYREQDVVMKGYFCHNEDIRGKRPGVLVVHEWWGHNEYARKRARMLAGLGYAALAVDMFGEGRQAMHPDEAGKFASELMKNFGLARSRFLAALEFLKSQHVVDHGRVAAIGYCFGGGVVLNMARQGIDLRGVASFHGNLTPVEPAQPGNIGAKILVLHGAEDKFMTPAQIEDFKNEMKNAVADFRFITYPAAAHSFTNPDADMYAKKFGLSLAYNAEADRKSWAELEKFLEEVFRE